MADMTLSWPRLTWPALALRHAAPWPRKISATSSAGRNQSAPQEGGRVELLVAEQNMDHADVDLLLEQMRGEAVPERVQRNALVDSRHDGRSMAGAVELARREGLHGIAAGKQPALWPLHLPIGAQ